MLSDHPEATGLPLLGGDVEIRNLTFTYPGAGKPALQDVSLSLKNGQILGIVGGIGAGKTTLANLLLRLYDPPEGSLWIDGVDVRRIPLDELRRAIAYVPQNGFLFSTTLSENIGFSECDPDAERIELAAKDAGVYDDIHDFPESFSTEIGERGVRLSGGQKQRVAIARMAYKDAAIRILDDSLSAVDTKTEQVILKNLHRDCGIRRPPHDDYHLPPIERRSPCERNHRFGCGTGDREGNPRGIARPRRRLRQNVVDAGWRGSGRGRLCQNRPQSGRRRSRPS
jgi:ABC-type multidrug transport system fused ATPase/permease subunit